MRLVAALLAVSVIAFLLPGCSSSKPGPPPPLKASFRKAQIPTRGMVAGLNNSSSSESIKVETVFVQGKDENEERSYRMDATIRPRDSISIGWVELDGWKLKSGDKLRIRCDGYDEDFMCQIPD